jgi:two-component system, response regulator PdtaR
MKLQDRRVLVVEDEEIMAMYIQEGLARLKNIESKWIARGEDAWLAVESFSPDLILMDIHLGQGMNGIETANYICSEKMIPIIFVSGLSDSSTLHEAQRIRPVGFLMKPFDYTRLKVSVEMGFAWSPRITKRQLLDRNLKLLDKMETDCEEEPMICMCSSCKSVRDQKGRWNRLEKFLHRKFHLGFSHGICPDCFEATRQD